MNRVAGSKGPRWRRRKEERPAEIIAAALETFAERGFAATRLDDIATRAGVTRGTLYLYFPSKEELFKAVVRQSIVPIIARGEEMVAQSQEPSSALLANVLLMMPRAVAGKATRSGKRYLRRQRSIIANALKYLRWTKKRCDWQLQRRKQCIPCQMIRL